MIVNISRGVKGIKKYLEDGQKKDREFNREAADKRVILTGDLELTDSIIKQVHTKSKYYHIVLSFKEDFVSNKDLKKAVDEFQDFAFSAYNKNEYNFYAEAHQPKLKSYLDKKTGKYVIRHPHVHIVIPEINLVSGLQLKPLGFIKSESILSIDSFNEKFNMDNGFASPKKNRSNCLKDHNLVLREEILNQILERKINSNDDFKLYLEEKFEVKIRNKNKSNSYFSVKPEYHKKGTNLKDFVFSKEFIEDYSKDEKIKFLEKSAKNEKFLEKKTPVINKTKMREYDNKLSYWKEVISKEIKYINKSTKYYKDYYKHLSKDEKINILNQKEEEFYSKYNLEKEIEKEIKGISFNKDDLSFSTPPKKINPDNVVNQKIKDYKNDDYLEKIDFSKIDLEAVYKILKLEKGVNDVKFELDVKNKIVKCGSREYEIKGFLDKMMNYDANKIHHLSESIKEIEQKIISNNKEIDMAIKVNIKTNNHYKDVVDYIQVGEVDRVGKYTGFVYDQADKNRASSATLFVVKDKVVDYEEFRKIENFAALDEKMKLLVNTSKEQKYSKKLKMNYIRENLSLTDPGKVYANSKFNFKEIKPIEIGISKFDNSKKLDKNIFTKAKEFVLEHYYTTKDKGQALLTSKRDLAASNIALAVELKEMKIKLDDIKNIYAAEKINNQQKTNETTIETQKEQKEEQKNFSFKEVFASVRKNGDNFEKSKDAIEMINSNNFQEKRDTALELSENLDKKSDLIKLSVEEISNVNLPQAKAINLMKNNNLKVDSIKSVNKFIDILKNVKEMAETQDLGFEDLLKKTIKKLAESQNNKSKSKGAERE